MFVPESLKLNKFVICNLPSGRDLFAKLGLLSAGSSAQYSGEEELPAGMTKIEEIENMQEYDRRMQEEEFNKEY